MNLHTIICKTLRVPRSTGTAGDSTIVARQIDAVLAGVGLLADRPLLEHFSGLEPAAALGLALEVIAAVRTIFRDHIRHNSYFIDASYSLAKLGDDDGDVVR
jgi:hypothetical protein